MSDMYSLLDVPATMNSLLKTAVEQARLCLCICLYMSLICPYMSLYVPTIPCCSRCLSRICLCMCALACPLYVPTVFPLIWRPDVSPLSRIWLQHAHAQAMLTKLMDARSRLQSSCVQVCLACRALLPVTGGLFCPRLHYRLLTLCPAAY